ncbi:MAG: hypothetical protein HY721_01380 [Planctomycetes bacterium]|nr:hypothetical protein [Planctomycetota bacterium]
MDKPPSTALLRPAALLAVALSLSIGWGIRGNFGHEYGAMVPGALAALAACLFSGREDWRRRAPFFALLGALGWAFGGSMSYGQVIAYTHSGHLPSQVYGFACLFAIGFLWAALGGAGTAFAAAADEERLRGLFRPLLWVLGAWVAVDLALPAVERGLEGAAVGAQRHESLLYWFDADWIPALSAVAALLLFDLADRRFERLDRLALLAAAGAAAGFALQWLLELAGLDAAVAGWLVRLEGDPSMWARGELLTNWPGFLPLASRHLGWALGLAAGAGAYFFRWGRFRAGSSLLLHMALGWWAGFLLLPVLLGARMTPPRGDDWAGILGVCGGATLWLARSGFAPVVLASLVSGAAGGLGFSGAAWLKLVLVAPGNPARGADPAEVAAWAHWQSANWHSFLEQSYGLVNGLGIAVALAILATRLPRLTGAVPERPRWYEGFSVAFVLLGVTYLNLVKNVETWVEARAVPARMRAPLFASVDLSASAWFHLVYGLIAAAAVLLLVLHSRRRLAVAPETALGRGQLLYVLFLWWMVSGNFERALAGFGEGRLLTEGVIAVNAALVTVLVLALPRPGDGAPAVLPDPRGAARLITRAACAGCAAAVLAVLLQTWTVRALYGDKHAGHSGRKLRFGPEAAWRVEPLRKGKEHP